MLDQQFRDLMAGVCAPVSIVSAADESGPHGATVSSFASLSLRPPLISVALDRGSTLLARILASRRFGLNVLGSADGEMALLFARRGEDRFANVAWSMSQELPRLDTVPGWAACELQDVIEGGDHLLLIGLVTHAESRPMSPLVYGHRTFGTHSGFRQRPRPPIVDIIAACAQ